MRLMCGLTAVTETDGQQTQLTFSMLCSALAYPSHTPDRVYLHKILITYVFITCVHTGRRLVKRAC